jgi:mono/diheme cytochrome c family protein
LFGAAALVFAWHASSAAPKAAAPIGPASGAALFASRCASCHTVADARIRAAKARESWSKTLDTLEFLDGHSAATPAENRAIVGWLLSRDVDAR